MNGVHRLLTALALLATVVTAKDFFRISSAYNWKCENRVEGDNLTEGPTCVRYDSFENPGGMTLPACKLTCRPEGAVWPLPVTMTLNGTVAPVAKSNIVFTNIAAPSQEAKTMLEEMVTIFKGYLNMMEMSNEALGTRVFEKSSNIAETGSCSAGSCSPSSKAGQNRFEIDVVVTSESSIDLTHLTNESYALSIHTTGTKSVGAIVAQNVYGARHALETLSQLMMWDPEISAFLVTSQALITDQPAYLHRGLSMDTSRNYLPVSVLKNIIDGMSYNKLNVFHWHITDTNSYPLVSSRVPQLTLYGAYSPNHVYSHEDVKELVKYAKIRGVRIIPEFDAPAHVGNGWQWGPRHGLGELVLCANKEPWEKYCVQPPCGQLNPVNENIYKILKEVYRDYADVFDSDVFHMGGDEVMMTCWNETADIIKWMEDNGRINRTQDDFLDLWSIFQNKALALVDTEIGGNKPIMFWTSDLTSEDHVEKYLDKNRYVIQVWDSSKESNISSRLYEKGYRLIMSNWDAWYLDCGYSGWVGAGHNWCSPYKGWQLMYENNPEDIVRQGGAEVTDRSLIWGGEAALWSEQVDEASVMGKIFPRLSSVAERLWNNPSTGWKKAEIRFVHHRQRMVSRGIKADAIQPLWCHQNERLCYITPTPPTVEP